MEDRNRNEKADGVVVSCTMKDTHPKFGPRLYAVLTPQEWRGVVSASAIGSRTPAQVIKAAIREYLERRDIIIEPKIASGGATGIRGENRVLVMSRNGGILRQFVCTIPEWAFDALQFAAENDGAPIGKTCAAAIYHFAAHRGIPPPRRMKAEVDRITEVARLAVNTDIPDTVRDDRGGVRRILELKAWERDAVRIVANHDGDPAGRIIAHAVRYYVAKVRGVEPPPEQAESVERVRTERDCAFARLRYSTGPGGVAVAQAQGQTEPETPPESATGTPPESVGEN